MEKGPEPGDVPLELEVYIFPKCDEMATALPKRFGLAGGIKIKPSKFHGIEEEIFEPVDDFEFGYPAFAALIAAIGKRTGIKFDPF